MHYSYDASAHLAEETKEASAVVAKGMWMATLSGWLLSIPTLILILFCIQDFDGIIAGMFVILSFKEYPLLNFELSNIREQLG